MKFLISLLLMLPMWAAGQPTNPPDNVIENIAVLATLKGPIISCKASDEYQNLDIKRKIKYLKIDGEIDGLILRVSKFYKNIVIFEFYLRQAKQHSQSLDASKQMLRKYGAHCSEKMIKEIENNFIEAEKIF